MALPRSQLDQSADGPGSCSASAPPFPRGGGACRRRRLSGRTPSRPGSPSSGSSSSVSCFTSLFTTAGGSGTKSGKSSAPGCPSAASGSPGGALCRMLPSPETAVRGSRGCSPVLAPEVLMSALRHRHSPATSVCRSSLRGLFERHAGQLHLIGCTRGCLQIPGTRLCLMS